MAPVFFVWKARVVFHVWVYGFFRSKGNIFRIFLTGEEGIFAS
ncbi:hypothetical protein B4113_0960 [Geobacillus sp. B4113_201601]|nr:hypothetical protein B4113_0960 [Geobacillus sp. B4113_201601]